MAENIEFSSRKWKFIGQVKLIGNGWKNVLESKSSKISIKSKQWW